MGMSGWPDSDVILINNIKASEMDSMITQDMGYSDGKERHIVFFCGCNYHISKRCTGILSTSLTFSALCPCYNMKFNLGIDLEEKLTYDRFEKGARDRSNQTALDFLKFYKDEFKNLKKDPTFKLLYDKRNIRIHRAGAPVRGEFYRGLSETVMVHDSVSILVIRKSGNNEQFFLTIEIQRERLMGRK
jgi:hypothetical protein